MHKQEWTITRCCVNPYTRNYSICICADNSLIRLWNVTILNNPWTLILSKVKTFTMIYLRVIRKKNISQLLHVLSEVSSFFVLNDLIWWGKSLSKIFLVIIIIYILSIKWYRFAFGNIIIKIQIFEAWNMLCWILTGSGKFWKFIKLKCFFVFVSSMSLVKSVIFLLQWKYAGR